MFTATDVALRVLRKLNIRPELLLKTLWGEFYFSAKAKRIYTRPSQNDVAPMFVQFCLKNLWDVVRRVFLRCFACLLTKRAVLVPSGDGGQEQ